MEKTIRVGRRPFDAEITYESDGPGTDRGMKIAAWLFLVLYGVAATIFVSFVVYLAWSLFALAWSLFS